MFNFRLYFGIIKSISMSGKYIFICMKNFKFIQLFKAVRGGIYMAKTFKSGVTLLILTFFCSIFIFGNSAILKNVNAAAKINQSSSSTQIASVKYKINDGTITIYGKGKMPNSMTFKKNRQIHTVIIRNGVTSVSKYAFYNCKNLQKVKLPNTLKVINCYAFYGTKIKKIIVPMLGVEPVITDLALTSPFHVPQGQTVIPQAIIERSENATNRQETPSRPDCMPCAECTAMVTYLIPDMETQKHRSESATLYIDYPTGVYDVRREFHNNRPELEKLDSLMRPLTEGNLASISSISICGYASPDGIYKDNEILASNRARCFKEYMRATYAPGYDLYKVSSVPEDWDGLVELLQRHPMNHGDEVLSLIARTGIFEGREKQLMDMHGGAVYRELLKSYFPQLRRIRVTVGYEARAFNIEEAASLIYTHPRLLSLQEMYRVAAFYRPGTEQYREIYEIAAYHFPDDVLANINAASAVIMAGDPVSARQYLSKVADDPRAWNDFGVLAYLEGDWKKAEEWFRKALGIEPEKARKNLKKMKYEE